MRPETEVFEKPAPSSPDLRPMPLEPLPERPLVSVLITSYNYEKYIGEAIESVLAQTYTNFEVIVCDDGSSDGSCEVIERYCERDGRVQLVRQANGGQGSATSTAFGHAAGEIIVVLDGDDIALENRLELIVRKFQENPEAGVVTHAWRILDAHGNITGRDPEEPLDEGWLAPALLHGPDPVFPPSIALRMQLARRIFPLPWRKIPHAHWDWVIREAAAFLAPVAALDEMPGLYRLHGRSLFGHPRFIALDEIEKRLAGLAGAMEARRLYARAFLGVEPDEAVCNRVIGVLVLSRAVLKGERLNASQIAEYSCGRARKIWTVLFLLPPWLTRRLYVWARQWQLPMKGRWLKGNLYRALQAAAGIFRIQWKPGRRVRQSSLSSAYERQKVRHT